LPPGLKHHIFDIHTIQGQIMFSRSTWSLAFAFTLVLLLWTTSGFAQRGTDPFGGLAGSWSGPGTITLSSGAKERLRCRATYDVEGSARRLQISLRCASDSYKFELQSAVTHNDGAISGTWTEATRNAGGTLSGTANGSKIQANATGPAFSASLAFATRANTQTVSIHSPGSEISAVAITLTKGSK
jgi:hypothetical protein